MGISRQVSSYHIGVSNQCCCTYAAGPEPGRSGQSGVWSLGMYLILASSKGISAVKLGEQLGVQYRTAWHLAHRIRAAAT